MNVATTSRSLLLRVRLAACAGVLGLCAATAAAQRGPGGGGPPGGGSPGGGPPGTGAGGMDRGEDRMGSGFTATPGTARSGPALAPPGLWWHDKHLAKTLNLRNDQQKRMDEIFDARKGNLMNLLSNLRVEEQKLSSMSREDLQDENKVFAAIDRVAQARAELEKENAHILMQLRRELDTTQLAALDRETAAR